MAKRTAVPAGRISVGRGVTTRENQNGIIRRRILA